MAAPTCTITMIKRMTYRGNPNEEYSNTYNFKGPTPADSTAWRALFDALATQEKTLFPATVSIIGGYGYNKVPGPGDSAVWTVDLTVAPNSTVPGTGNFAGAGPAAGDAAVWVRWGLDRFNTKGKRIYLRKYFHPAVSDASVPDVPVIGQRNALTAFGGKLRDGTFLDGRVITDKLGTAVVGAGVCPYVTTRTLKRRGKRPGS